MYFGLNSPLRHSAITVFPQVIGLGILLFGQMSLIWACCSGDRAMRRRITAVAASRPVVAASSSKVATGDRPLDRSHLVGRCGMHRQPADVAGIELTITPLAPTTTTRALTKSDTAAAARSKPSVGASAASNGRTWQSRRTRRSWVWRAERLTWVRTGAVTIGRIPTPRRIRCSAHIARSLRSAASRAPASSTTLTRLFPEPADVPRPVRRR